MLAEITISNPNFEISTTSSYVVEITLGSALGGEATEQLQSDWSQTDIDELDYIKNKPTIPDELSDLSEDATHRTVTDTEKSTWNGKQNSLGFTPENTANKGQPNGYSGLGADGKVPASNINYSIDQNVLSIQIFS